jgi:DNA polymerase III delta prime subunit
MMMEADKNIDLLDVTKLEWPRMDETAIDQLVMPLGTKDLIKAIARTYTDKSQLFKADFIYGKGEGQIILLHGPPGTGKTLTAGTYSIHLEQRSRSDHYPESVAEFTGRPLLNITAADLGHEPDLLEKSLLQYFRRANDWDAIVPLDEANVYLEKRSKNDLKRNSIVSGASHTHTYHIFLSYPSANTDPVFLRALDYFRGIPFPPTNLINQSSSAFKSLIHLSPGSSKLNDPTHTPNLGKSCSRSSKTSVNAAVHKLNTTGT